jgi:two-component system response regulator PilR (NtrC family)
MQSLRAQIARLARSMAPISITGESGSGKELAAREIHAQSSRAARPFVAVNCGAIPEALMEAEFFGYRKGAFTGAAEERDGFFQAANGGTLMLDEVADLPLPMQVKLLRAIQERRVRKIGATTEDPVDVRIVSATHQDLARCVAEGRFRQDLFYRLNVIELHLPPLRERLDDLPLLAGAILARLAGPGEEAALGEGVLETLGAYSFPGNVRELENVLERALAFADDGVIDVADLSLKSARPAEAAAPAAAPADPVPAALESPLPNNLPDYLNQVERDIILRALNQTQFNRTQAAGLLGISLRQLRYQMQKLGIQAPEG